MFVLCDCETGTVLDFIIYTGKGTDIEHGNVEGELSSKVIKTLMKPYLNSSHVIFMDNWYSRPTLFDWLIENGTGACGTVNPIRKNLPCLLKKWEVVVRDTENTLAVKWCDKRPVTVV